MPDLTSSRTHEPMKPSTGAAVRLHRNAVRDRPESLSAFKWNACPPSPEYPPRVPSMTAAEAEAAIGRRGEVTVTADNRGLVRKWFVAQGLPTLFVGGLSMRELALAYNDTKGEQFSR